MMVDSDIENKFLTLLSDVVLISKKQLKKDVTGTKVFIFGTGWRASLYWVLKLEEKRQKIKVKKPEDITRDVIKAYEKHGRLMHSVLGLCEIAYSFESEKWEYDSYPDWFESILNEAAQASYNLEEKSKTRKLQKEREYLQLLHNFKNPYNSKTEPHLWQLIQSWTTRLAGIPKLEELYWIPFKRSFSRWITERDSSAWVCIFEEKTETQVTLKSTKGQGHRHLNLACTVTIKD